MHRQELIPNVITCTLELFQKDGEKELFFFWDKTGLDMIMCSRLVFKIVEAIINKTKCFVHLDHLPTFADATYTSCGC